MIVKEGIEGLKNLAVERWEDLKITEKYKPQIESFLTHRKGLTKKGIHLQASSKTMVKVVKEGLKLKNGSTKRVKQAGYTFRVTKDPSGKIDIAAKVAVLGRGAFKEVSKYMTLGSAKTFALMKAKVKRSSSSDIGQATEALKSEYAILDAIYANRDEASLPGLQSKPHAIYTIEKVEKKTDTTKTVGFMEADLYDGGDLWELIFSNTEGLKRLSIDERLKICQSLAEGCQELHERGIVHRDIKPDNIMLKLDEDGKVREAHIIDFGLAHIVDKGKFKANTKIDPDEKPNSFTEESYMDLAGTSLYLATGDLEVVKEQDDAKRIEGRYKHDIFSLGRTFIEFITGKSHYFEIHKGRVVDMVDLKQIEKDLSDLGVNQPLLTSQLLA